VQKLAGNDAQWSEVRWPANLALVGTVNMDESAHGFSRKVLDRAFTLEMSDVDLDNWKEHAASLSPASQWPIESWYPRASRLGDLQQTTEEERTRIAHVVKALTEANTILTSAQLQVGYRVRDEVALFVLHASDVRPWFRTQPGEEVDPLDLALQMK